MEKARYGGRASTRPRGSRASALLHHVRHRVVVAELRMPVRVAHAGGGAEGPQRRLRTREELEIVRHLDDRVIQRSRRGGILVPQRPFGPGERPSAPDEEHRDDDGDQEEHGGEDPRQEVEEDVGLERCGREGRDDVTTAGGNSGQ